MSNHALGSALLAALLLAAPPALAGPPGAGNLLCGAAGQLRFVHDANSNGVRDTGENTTCQTPVLDDSVFPAIVTDGAGGPRCVQADVARIRSLVTLVADDTSFDNNNLHTGSQFTILMEIRENGKAFTVADSFTAASNDLTSLDLGNWDPGRFSGEESIFDVGFNGVLFLAPPTATPGAFDEIAAKLTSIAGQLGLVPNPNDVLPVIVDEERDAARKRLDTSSPTGCTGFGSDGCGQAEVDEDSSNLASVAQYRVTIHYVEKITTATPCAP